MTTQHIIKFSVLTDSSPCYLLRTGFYSTTLKMESLYSSPSIIRVIKSRRVRWAGHAARMGERRNAYRILVGKLHNWQLLKKGPVP
jgi:hypothetical protein